MNMVKRHFVLILALIALAGYMICQTFLWSQIAENTIMLKDKYGDKNVISDITISGMITDGRYKQVFNLNGEKVTFQFKPSYQNDINTSWKPLPGNQPIRLMTAYQPSKDANTSNASTNPNVQTENLDKGMETVYYDKVDLYFNISDRNKTNFTFKTDVSYYSATFDINISRVDYGNGLATAGYGFTGLDSGASEHETYLVCTNNQTGRIFVYNPTGTSCRGFGGAYEITDQLKKSLNSPQDQPLSLKNIAPIDLKDGAVRIVDMDTAGNMLLFVVAQYGEFVLKPFDLSRNEFLEDISLGEYSIASYEKAYAIKVFTESNEDYISISILLKHYAAADEDNNMLFAVYDTKKKSKVMQYEESVQNSYVQTQLDEIVMCYKNNKLYVLRKMVVFDMFKYGNNGGTNHEVRVTAMNDKLLYDGFLDAHTDDDRQFQGNQNMLQGRIYFRDYYNLSID